MPVLVVVGVVVVVVVFVDMVRGFGDVKKLHILNKYEIKKNSEAEKRKSGSKEKENQILQQEPSARYLILSGGIAPKYLCAILF